MKTIVENMPFILLCLAMLAVVISCFYSLVTMPSQKRKNMLEEWLKIFVTEAEKKYGGKTGQLKLRWVYEKAVETFPWLIKMMDFDVFSLYVDAALIWMRKQMEENIAFRNYVGGYDENISAGNKPN
jgi:hypothetical protein